jgi:signal transduction histidine kinase/HAMP domain-containing protein
MYNHGMNTTVSLGIFDLVGTIMLVFASTSFIYLLVVKNISNSSRMLRLFFFCVILSSLATIVTNIGTSWDWAFAPAQDAFLILGGIFLVRFAYLFPENDQPVESRRFIFGYAVIAGLALTYAVIFAIRYFANLPEELQEIQAYYYLTPLSILLLVGVFFRRSLHFSTQLIHPEHEIKKTLKSAFTNLLKPGNRPALGLRNYGLALGLGMVPVIVVLLKNALPGVVTTIIFNFGGVIAVSAVMLTYFNHAPESFTLSAKLVGISLVSVLLILGLAGVWIYLQNPQLTEHTVVSSFIALVLISSMVILFLFPIFFRTAVLDPLKRLSGGIKAANQGELTVYVPVTYDDEIGYITQSFNNMISSLNEATQELIDESMDLEKLVGERTDDLQLTNQQLTQENLERKEAQSMLDRQLRYGQALSDCSQALLQQVDGEERQHQVITQALEHLRAGATVSRAYLFQNLRDNELGLCMSLKAESCAEHVRSHLSNPANQKFPYSGVPEEMQSKMADGQPFGGPVERVFAATPNWVEEFMHQSPPLLSTLTLPVFFNNQWWGFIGFDDCNKAHEWDIEEVIMLRTASEMIGNTLQRWQAENQMRATLENLEQRVAIRTRELTQANLELRHEIIERQRVQDELVDRLVIESNLANISARLMSPVNITTAIHESLADLSQVMLAKRVVYLEILDDGQTISRVEEWYPTGEESAFANPDARLASTIRWFIQQLDSGKSIYIKDPGDHPDPVNRARLTSKQLFPVLLTPVIIEHHLTGIIACIHPELPEPNIIENIQSVEVVASMLGAMLQRESLLNLLEEKVAERTREISAFFDMTMLSGEAQEIADLMQPALAKVIEISYSSAGAIYLYDSELVTLTLVALRGFPGEINSGLPATISDESIIGWMQDIGRQDDADLGTQSLTPKPFLIPGHPVAVYIPLFARGTSQGLLVCYRQEDIAYNPYQVSFLNAIGEQLGMAVESYRLRVKAEQAATLQERQRLARELHDAVSQSLYSLMLFARSGRDAYESGNQTKLLDSLEMLEENSLAALKEMRLLIYQLRSLALEQGGLVQAIENRFNLVERRSGTQASIIMDQGVTLPEHEELELFLLITEALNNALKHAAASQVSVSLVPENGRLVLVVWNNGKSFDPTQEQGGMGLENMRTRAAALRGLFSIQSQPGSGTWIRVEIPRT